MAIGLASSFGATGLRLVAAAACLFLLLGGITSTGWFALSARRSAAREAARTAEAQQSRERQKVLQATLEDDRSAREQSQLAQQSEREAKQRARSYEYFRLIELVYGNGAMGTTYGPENCWTIARRNAGPGNGVISIG